MTANLATATGTQLDSIAIQHERRNFLLGVVNGGLFNLAETLIDPSLVLAVFVSQLTNSSLLVGLLYPLRDGGWYLPQFWMSTYLQTRPRQLPTYTMVAMVRAVAWLFMALAPFVIADRGWLLAAVFGLYAICRLGAGFSGLAFMDVVAKTVRPVRRGPFYSWRTLSGGLLAIGGGLLVNSVVNHGTGLVFPHDFGLLFVLAWIFGTVGMFLFSFIVEPPDRAPKPRVRIRNQWGRARTILAHDANYRNMLVLRSILLYAQAAIPFFAVYALRNLSAGTAWIGIFLTVRTVAGLASTAIWGEVSARLGNRLVVLLAAVIGVVSTGLILATVELAAASLISLNIALLALTLVFALVGAHTAALEVAASPLLLDMAPPADRTLYTGFAHTLLGLVLLSTAISGLLVDWAGLSVVFVASLVLYGLACWYAVRIREPRQVDIRAG